MGLTAVINPYSQSVITEVKLDSEEEALKKLQKAYQYYQNRNGWLKIKDRMDVLARAYQLFKNKRDIFIETAIKEGGKPYKDTVIEVDRGISGIDIAMKELFHFKGEVINMGFNEASMNKYAFSIKEPKGVVLAISAFNHPFNLSIHQIIPSIAVGCPVLIKPSLKTPLSAKLVVDTLYEAGVPENLCQYLLIENDVTEKLIQNPMIAYMYFIGSSRVGWYLRSKLAPGANCVLEHGGIAPVIVDEDVDTESIIPKIIHGAFYHAGQVCISVQRVFVHASLVEKFCAQLVEQSNKLILADPFLANTDVGPLITVSDVNRIDHLVKDAMSNKATLLCGGQKVGTSLYMPTILLNPSLNAKVSTEEAFGPVLAVYAFNDLSEAIKRANEGDYYFQSSIFSNNINKAFKTAEKLNACAVMINEHTAFRVDYMPFRAHRISGLGTGGIGYLMRDLSIDKLLVVNLIS